MNIAGMRIADEIRELLDEYDLPAELEQMFFDIARKVDALETIEENTVRTPFRDMARLLHDNVALKAQVTELQVNNTKLVSEKRIIARALEVAIQDRREVEDGQESFESVMKQFIDDATKHWSKP